MIIHLATDHTGVAHKEAVKAYLLAQGIDVIDYGASEVIEGDDYPDYVVPCAQAVVADPDNSMGVIFGGSGQGEAMCANRVPGIRAAVFYGGTTDILTLSREHNAANVLSLAARYLSPDEAIQAVTLWLATPFSNDERHVRRLGKF
ncbi:MAG: RpiB/LacA/LacB family sugar-phosphate isomerase [Candidatus Pacebacteria bacterium]|nr:RpiB/LacA/LacB family sugar-phosphate isomerase [Candidatus Paceibacterota bacterium]MBP9700865.1 RpiB/LacA/LacB family sugar-phosphate isomerase [Candidatus Paceibacterota bacterium]